MGRHPLTKAERENSAILHVRMANSSRAFIRDVARMRGMTIQGATDWAIECLREKLSTLPMGRGKA
jgi:hypothetical protein